MYMYIRERVVVFSVIVKNKIALTKVYFHVMTGYMNPGYLFCKRY